MIKKFVLGLAAAALLVGTAVTDADAKRKKRRVDTNKGWERQIETQAELERARAVGGYDDPVTAIVNLFNGKPAGKNLQENILWAPQPNGTIWDN